MKLSAKNSNTTRLVFNDLGSDIRGVSDQAKLIALSAGESVYLPDQSGVLYSVWKGDAHKFAAAGLLDIDDLFAGAAAHTIIHNLNYVPKVSCVKLVGGAWVDAIVGVDYTTSTNAAMTTTVVTTAVANVLVHLS